ncbi:loricrin, putative [Trichomonas vaginalis G3]|uniref:receptor protein-tyrosine kinase n=1 Tax=Trichomonas vaginalis (strain ATCC PRA-98 / G3) TaxID=412133 RepID=A2F944_TRIV3|nr:glycine-rich protein family [Trichomonas vaginalis G3]EAX98572.1 loricrin, putative [Trichomonas vaginalis G3]KAI5505229.1 glycine-rich protein family [Trichomonas vaginalis G3]|eukprot:XP_001311502.1 loricrin [Trichomonas vaginalis G3]
MGIIYLNCGGCSSGNYPSSSDLNPSSPGAYVRGQISLSSEYTFYLHVCHQGEHEMKYYAYGGGGPGQQGGGGATDIRLKPGKYEDFDSLKSRIIVASGGGGPDTDQKGGPGGGLYGHNSTNNYRMGGTQNQGGNGFIKGKFGIGGGNPDKINGTGNGAGGSGYFGGGSSNISTDFGGGGGSSFISGYKGCIAIAEESTENNIFPIQREDVSIHYSNLKFDFGEMIDGKSPMPSPSGPTEIGHHGNGFIRITFLYNLNFRCSFNLINYFLIPKSFLIYLDIFISIK